MNVPAYPLLRRKRWSQKNELRSGRLTSVGKARRHLTPIDFDPRLNKHVGSSLRLGNRNGTRGSLPHPLCLCLGSLAASGPAKVVGLGRAKKWIADWHTDFGGPAAVGEATEATATGKAPGIQAGIQLGFKTGQTRSPGRGPSTRPIPPLEQLKL